MGENAFEDNDVAEKIVTAARDCYAHFGVGRTSMPDIARVAGVSRATVYRYFPGTGALRDAVIARMGSEVIARIDAATKSRQDLTSFIAKAFEVLVAYNREMHYREHITDPETRLSAALFNEHLQIRRFAERVFGARLQEAAESGELAPDLKKDDALELLIMLMESIGGPGSDSALDLKEPAECGRWVARVVCDGIRTPTPAPARGRSTRARK